MGKLSQFKGVSNTESAPKHSLADTIDKASSRAGEATDEGTRISYGRVVAVDHKTSQVKVIMFREAEKGGQLLVKQGAFIPLLTPLGQIHLLWGALREGLACRIYWRGKHEPQQAIVEIVGDEETSNFLTQPISVNDIATGPWKILTGGMTG